MLIYALASCDESQLWVEMSRDLGYIDDALFGSIYQELDEVGKMLYSFIKTI